MHVSEHIGRNRYLVMLVVLAGSFSPAARTERFIAPASGTLYVKCIGGSAGDVSQFGMRSPTLFRSSTRCRRRARPRRYLLVPSAPDKRFRLDYIRSGKEQIIGRSPLGQIRRLKWRSLMSITV